MIFSTFLIVFFVQVSKCCPLFLFFFKFWLAPFPFCITSVPCLVSLDLVLEFDGSQLLSDFSLQVRITGEC